jgi:hypothetical protein
MYPQPQRGLQSSLLHAEVFWINGVVEFIKSQTPSTKF